MQKTKQNKTKNRCFHPQREKLKPGAGRGEKSYGFSPKARAKAYADFFFLGKLLGADASSRTPPEPQ
jgi:hypothetical protein